MNLQINEQKNNMPGIEYQDNQFEGNNPSISSPYSPFEVPFKQTRESLLDVESYRKFLENAISRFRGSRSYKKYKEKLYEIGMNKCQLHGNIDSSMATIEMHHNVLTIFDIAMIITEHTLNTYGFITTFDLVYALKKEHKANRVQLVMLSLTPHKLYHNEEGIFIHPNMCFGDWIAFLRLYYKGITLDIANKVLRYIDDSILTDSSGTGDLLEVREQILDWSIYNASN